MRQQTVQMLLNKWGINLDKWKSAKAGQYRLQLGHTVMRVQEKIDGKWVVVYSAYFNNLKVKDTNLGTLLGPFDKHNTKEDFGWLNLDTIAK